MADVLATSYDVPPGAIQERIDWAFKALRARGVQPDRALRPQHNVWSVIVPIRTDRGPVFLKYVRGAYGHEPVLTRALQALAPGHVPEVIADDAGLTCWLVADAGDEIALPAFLRDDRLPPLLAAHAGLQRRTAPHRDAWLALGARDLRPARWPGYLASIRAARNALDLDNVTAGVVAGLAAAQAPLAALAARLTDLDPPAGIVHMDFRRTNLRGSRRHAMLIDWGDAGHGPVFLDPVPLLSEAATLDLPAGRLAELRAAAIAPWTDLQPAETLREAQRLCRVAFPMLYAHGLITARPTHDPTLRPSYYGLLQFYLKTFLDRLARVAP